MERCGGRWGGVGGMLLWDRILGSVLFEKGLLRRVVERVLRGLLRVVLYGVSRTMTVGLVRVD